MATGPAPNPNSRRSTTGSNAHTWVNLPAGGYTGPIPEWPLEINVVVELCETEQTELAVWNKIWRTPMAAAWAKFEWYTDVAMYCRHHALGATGRMEDAKEARMWSDRLGLNPQAMLRNRWRVVDDEFTAARTAKTAKPAARKRRQLKVADDAVAGS